MDAPMPALSLEVGGKRYPVASLADASRKVEAARDASGIGGSQFPTPLLYDGAGKLIGYVSYNGRVWAGHPRDWQPDGVKPIFDNRGAA